MSSDPAAAQDPEPVGGPEHPRQGGGRGGRHTGAGRRGVISWQVRPRFRVAFVAVLVLMVLSVLACVALGFTAGGYALAGTLVVAAALRLTLSPEYCLGLIVRSRRTDVATCLLLAGSLALSARSVPGS